MFRRFVAYEVAAWTLSLLCGVALLVVKVQANAAQRVASRIGSVSAQRAQSPDPLTLSAQATSPAGNADTPSNEVMGRLEIQSIGLTVPILDGFDPAELRKGIGHIHGTAMPGGLGNMALAGHRDTFFRPLRNIRKGMTVAVFTGEGRFDYVVDSMSIVDPDQVSVLAIHNTPEMTLITCYPFDYIGAAPHRFIVSAHLESIEPASN